MLIKVLLAQEASTRVLIVVCWIVALISLFVRPRVLALSCLLIGCAIPMVIYLVYLGFYMGVSGLFWSLMGIFSGLELALLLLAGFPKRVSLQKTAAALALAFAILTSGSIIFGY